MAEHKDSGTKLFYDGIPFLIKKFKESENSNRGAVLSILMELYNYPHCKILRQNYDKNKAELSRYPFWFGPNIPAFDELHISVLPIDGNTCAVFSSQDNSFHNIEINSERETKYFFSDLSQPLFVESETNEYNLHFIKDNVRLSEDVAMENHIYLYYESADNLFAAMQMIDFSKLLEDEKFVFLIGKENRTKYPINFAAEYGIDYGSMQAKEIQLKDIKRLAVAKPSAPSCGSFFFMQLLDYHPNLVTHPYTTIDRFHHYGFTFMHNLSIKKFLKIFRRIPEKYLNSYKNFYVIEMFEKIKFVTAIDWMKLDICKLVYYGIPQGERKKERLLRYLSLLCDVLKEKPNPEAIDWFSGLLLAYNRLLGRNLISRIAPSIFYEAHISTNADRSNEFIELCLNKFKYTSVMVVARDVLSLFSSNAEVTVEKIPNYFRRERSSFASIYSHLCHDNQSLYFESSNAAIIHWRIVRFEDFKLNLRASNTALAEFLNLPWSENLMQTTINGEPCGLMASVLTNKNGLDPISVRRHLKSDQYLSRFDKYKTEMLCERYYAPFGYVSKFYDGKKYTWSQTAEMLMQLFRGDELLLERGVVSKETLLTLAEEQIPIWKSVYVNPVPVDKNGMRLKPIQWLRPCDELLETHLYE